MPADQALAAAAVPQALLERIAERATAVDAATDDPRQALVELAQAGLLTLGAPGHPGTITDMAAVLGAVAGECLSSAFCAWGHRMALEYLAPGGGERVADLADLRRIGSSAMAGAFKAYVGLERLSVRARRHGHALVLDGSIAWASNLHDDALVVLAVDVDETGPAIVAVPVGTDGLTISPARGLLALEATASGRLVFEAARVEADARHIEPFHAFVARVRRPFLALQSGFCLGLARAALSAGAGRLTGLGAEFADEHARLSHEHERAAQRLAALADDEDVPIRELVRLRLDVAVVAREAVRVEATLTGGRGYIAASPTARRLREAAFLPVQSPTEGQLRWELR